MSQASVQADLKIDYKLSLEKTLRTADNAGTENVLEVEFECTDKTKEITLKFFPSTKTEKKPITDNTECMRDAKLKLHFTDKKVFLCDHSKEEQHFLQKT